MNARVWLHDRLKKAARLVCSTAVWRR